MTRMPSVSAKLLPSRMKDRRSAPGIVPASTTLSGNVSGTNATQPASWKRQNNGRRDQMARKLPMLWQGSPEACIMLSSPAPLLGDLLSENIGKREVLAAEDPLDFSQCRRLLAICKAVQRRFSNSQLAGKAGIALLTAQSFQKVRKCLVQTGHFPSLARFSFRMCMIFHLWIIRLRCGRMTRSASPRCRAPTACVSPLEEALLFWGGSAE